MAFPDDINLLVTVNASDSLQAAGHAARHNEVRTALLGVQQVLGGTATPSGTVSPVLAAGTATAPSLSFTGDSNTGLWSPAADAIAASTGGTERFRIDNAGLITGSGTSLGAWTSYTPTLGGTGWAIGNGTATGAYCQIGKIIIFRAEITLGSTSTFGSTNPTVSLPVTAKNEFVNHVAGTFQDTSAGTPYTIAINVNTTAVVCRTLGTGGIQQATTSTNPFTWASTDLIRVYGLYEIA